MELIIYIVIGLAIIGFFGDFFSSNSNSRKKVVISDYIDTSSKYTYQDAWDVVDKFAEDIGFKADELPSATFQNIVQDCLKEYKREMNSIQKEIDETSEHYEKQLKNEEDEEEIKSIQKELKSEIKHLTRQLDWYKKERQKFSTGDYKTLTRKVLIFMNKEKHMPEMWDLALPKELPDSYQ